MNLVKIVGWIALIGAVAASPVYAADANIGETPEIRFSTPDAKDLNDTANNLQSPPAIYEYVRNNYDYALYQGSRSDSVNTFLGSRGSDVDLASTLIAMFRSLTNPIPSRYAVGVVRVGAADLMNWLGVKNLDLAVALLKDQGIQKVVLSADRTTVDFEHVWVEALVATDNYRGAGLAAYPNCAQSASQCQWVALDPSFKLRRYRADTIDIYNAVSFDYTAYYNAIKNNDATRRDKNPLEIYEAQILDYLRVNYPGRTLEDVADPGVIIAQNNGILPASLPYSVIGTPNRYNSVADHDAAGSKKWAKYVSGTFEMNVGGVSIQAGLGGPYRLADLVTQRLTVTFDSVSSPQRVVVRLGGTDKETPFTMGGTINGQKIQLGQPFSLTLKLDGAPSTTGSVDGVITVNYDNMVVGGYYLIGTGGDTSNWSQVHRAADQLLSANQQYPIVLNPTEPSCSISTGLNCTPYVDSNGNGWDASDKRLLDHPQAMDALTGGLLYAAMTQYFAKFRDEVARFDALDHVISPIEGFVGVVSSVYDVEYIDGTAFSVLPGGLLIDMKGQRFSGTWRTDAAMTSANKHFELLGHGTSSLEHEIWQELTGYDAVSTVRGIQMALAGGASLVSVKRNQATNTVPQFLTSMGFGTLAPSPFAMAQRDIYGTRPTTWSHPTFTGGEGFDVLKKAPTSSSDPRLSYLSYYNNYWHSNIGCFDDTENQLDSLRIALGGSATLYAASNCGVSWANGTTIDGAIAKMQAGYSTYRGGSNAALSNYLDVLQGFNSTDFVYRTNLLPSSAYSTSYVAGIRNDLLLRDVTQSSVEYILPSTLVNGANYIFETDIRKAYVTATGDLVSLMFEIANRSLAAGGGYVDATKPLEAATSVAGTSQVLPTFNNATFTDKNVIAQANNDAIRTPSTVDPVSTVTGNNYHDETDITIKGRGLDMVFTRTYNSAPASTAKNGPLGYGWTHSYNMGLQSNDYGDCPNCDPGTGAGQRPENGNNKTASITYTDERGGDHNYLVNESTRAVTPPKGEFDALSVNNPSAGLHTLAFRNGVRYVFEGPSDINSVSGRRARLKYIADPYGSQLNFGYDANGRLSTVTDNLGIAGRTGLAFTYFNDGHLQNIKDWGGRTWNYGYDSSGNLFAYTDPLVNTIRYNYATGTHNLQDISLPESRGGVTVTTTFKYYRNGKTFNYKDALNDTETLDYDLYRKTTRVTDPRGNIREYQYNSDGQLSQLNEPDGAVLQFDNTSDGLRYQKTDGLNYRTKYSYRTDRSFNTVSDNGGNVTREQDALGYNLDMDYGVNDQVTRVKDKNGNTTNYDYYATNNTSTGAVAGKLWRVSMATLGGVANPVLTEFKYNPNGTRQQQIEHIDATRTRVTNFFYDVTGLNLLSTKTTGSGQTIENGYTYDSLGRLKTQTLKRRKSASDPTLVSLTTTYEYDALSRVTKVTDPLGNYTQTIYDRNGKLAKVQRGYKKPDNTYDVRNELTRTYDGADRLECEFDVYSQPTCYSYDAAGNVSDVTDANSHNVHYEYDAVNRRTAVVDANGNRTQTSYDLAGHPKRTVDPDGSTHTMFYDPLGRVTKSFDALNNETQFFYDANGNVVKLINPNAVAGVDAKNAYGASVYKQYDELNRVVREVDAMNGETKYTYDYLGNQTSITDAENHTTYFDYDDLGRLVKIRDPLIESPSDKIVALVYDEAGNLLTRTLRSGKKASYTYDSLNRAVQADYFEPSTGTTLTEKTSYDLYGNVYTLSNPNLTYTFSYDNKKRLTAKTDSRFNKSLRFTYTRTDRIASKIDYQGETTTYGYDDTDRLVSERNPAYLEANYIYSSAGVLLSRVLSNGVYTNYGYDVAHRLLSMTDASGSGTTLKYPVFKRDPVGRIKQIDQNAPNDTGTDTYTYDALSRLSTAGYRHGSGVTTTPFDESFGYDKVGNRKTRTQNGITYYSIYDVGNRVKELRTGSATGPLVVAFVYDADGNATQKCEGGTVTRTETACSGSTITTLSYDAKNRVSSIAKTGQTTLTFKYDPLDYRIEKSSERYLLEGEHLEAIYNTSNQLRAKYLRGSVIDEIVNGYQYDANNKWTNYTFHHDQLNSVMGLTGHEGSVLSKTWYSAFGNVLSSTATTATNALKYTGRQLDESGFYYYRARYYDPSVGRFLQEDSLGFNAGINFYAYVNNNPVNGNDPNGLCPSCIGAGISVVTGGGIRYLTSGGDWNAVFDPASIATDAALGAVGAGLANKFSTLSQLSKVNSAPVPGRVLGQIGEDLAGISSTGKSSIPSLSGTATKRFPDSIDDFGNITEVKNVVSISTRDAAQIYDSVLYTSQPSVSGVTTLLTRGAATDISRVQGLIDDGLLNLGKIPGINSSGVANISTGTSSLIGFGAGTASNTAGGGFVLYPSKPNTNMMQSVYAK